MSRYETTVPWWSEGDAVCWTDSDGESVVIGLAANASDAQDICEARNADLADTPSVEPDWRKNHEDAGGDGHTGEFS